MGFEDEVIAIRKKLEKYSERGDSDGKVLEMLKALSKMKMSLSILTATRIGMTVNSIRKSSKDDDVTATAKSLIKLWKKLVPESEAKSKEKQKHREEVTKNGLDSVDDISTSSVNKRATSTADEVRISCRKLLAGALKGDGDLPEGICRSPEELAELIEDEIFKKMKGTTPKYKNQVRSRVFNLKDRKNQALRENVLCGLLTPDKIANMTSEEMASDEVRAKREAFVKEGINASQLARVEGTKTESFKCGRCGKRNCTYNQLQTRSADEPMTTFVMCNECGNRWKFC